MPGNNTARQVPSFAKQAAEKALQMLGDVWALEGGLTVLGRLQVTGHGIGGSWCPSLPQLHDLHCLSRGPLEVDEGGSVGLWVHLHITDARVCMGTLRAIHCGACILELKQVLFSASMPTQRKQRLLVPAR